MDTQTIIKAKYGISKRDLHTVPTWAKNERLERTVPLTEMWQMGDAVVKKWALQAIELEKWVLMMSILLSAVCCISIFISVYLFNLELVGVFLGFGLYYVILDMLFWRKYATMFKKLK